MESSSSCSSSSSSGASGSGKAAGGLSKTSGIPASTRLQRNLAEKERRDKLNGFISELATLIPMVSNASKPLDKVSILRLAAAEMRLHFSCLNPKKYKKKPLVLPPAIVQSLDMIEKTIGGFIVATTLTGLIVFCSRSIEDYLGYQNIDIMGNKITKYIYEDDIKFFESQVHSVVKSLKKAHKKTKVIKAHMLQKPLPRSTETCRPRNMIFKISVHQNDTSGENGHNHDTSHSVKTRPPKDFGYSAIVLLFIEPVRFEPEIDITYIDSNQDVYFTRHGLQGEIIYADQRISTITGYMPHDVQGTSAYQYICSSDVPIALFAQKAMFTSPDGKGVIVYRLRIRDMRCIYLQSSGQIAYKESSNEISHFVCFNRLLSEEEGSHELKKFQQRYAPQIMAAKMLQVKQNPGSSSPTIDLAFEQVMTLINNSPSIDAASTSAQTISFSSSAATSPNACSSIADQKPDEITTCSPGFSMGLNLVHSSESHSTISSVETAGPSIITLNCTPPYVNDRQIDAILETPEQRLGGGPLRRTDCSSSLSSSPYKTATEVRKEKILPPEQCRSGENMLHPVVVNEKFCNSVNGPNIYDETYRIHQNKQYVSIKSQNGTVHFVNVNNNLINGANVNGTHANHNNQSMVFDPTLPQKITFQLAASVPGQTNVIMTDVNQQLSEYLRRKEPISRNNSQTCESVETAPSILCDKLNFNERQNHGNQVSQIEDTLNPSHMYDESTVSNLKKNLSVSVHSDLYNGVDYSHNLNSYPQIGSYNYHLSSSINCHNSRGNGSAYNNFDNSKSFNSSEINGFHETVAPLDELKAISPMEIFDSAKIPVGGTVPSIPPQKTGHNTDIFIGTNISGTQDKTVTIVNQNSTQSAFLNNNEHEFSDSIDWSEILSLDPTGSEETPLNKELYSELESFFDGSDLTSQASSAFNGVSEFSVGNSSYPHNSISSQIKTIYQQ